MSFIEFLNESADRLDSESEKILVAFKKHLKECAKSDFEKVIEAIPCAYKGLPALAIFYWLGGTTNDAGFDDWEEVPFYDGGCKLSFNPKKEPGTEYAGNFSVTVSVFLLKRNININSLKIILKDEGYDFSENGNTLNIDSDDIKSKSNLESLLKKYKNVKFNWGGYYADVNNKHYVKSIDIVVS